MPNHSITLPTMVIKFAQQRSLILFAAVGLAAYTGMMLLHVRHGTLRDVHTIHLISWYFIAFAGYVLSLLWVEKQRPISPALIWGAAVIFRLLMLLTVPTLSDDVYRYMWDGYVANNGVSPYAYPIDSPALDYLDIPQRAQANNRWMASPYLPTAQLLFTTLTRFFPLSALVFQIVMIGFDLLAGLLIAKLLALAGQPTHRILIYLWNPLVIVEVAHGAHLEALMVCLMLGSVWLTYSPRQTTLTTWLAPIVLALATLTKILPIFLLTVLFWRWCWRQSVLFGLVIVVLLVPFGLNAGWGATGPLDGTGVFGAIRIYADKWNFNSGLFHWLEADWLPLLGLIETVEPAKRIMGLALLLTLGFVWLAARKPDHVLSMLRLMALPYMAYLLFTTTVHPWYLLILMVFLPFLAPTPPESSWRWLSLSPWLYLSSSIFLSYITYLDPLDFRELEWVRQAEWRPTLLLLLIWLIVRTVKRSHLSAHGLGIR